MNITKTVPKNFSFIENLDPKEFIIIKGARVNNLKNIDIAIPRNKLIVITGVSGSGKSSLAFDTLFAEGQRMYVESLSSYARQFLGRMEKPEVDYIKGVSPAIAIEQKVSSKNPRSTVGTSTEIYDYLKLLFARIGKTYSPLSGALVKKDTVTDIVNFIQDFEDGTRYIIKAPLYLKGNRKPEEELNVLLQKGFTRMDLEGEIIFIEDLLQDAKKLKKIKDFNILIDRGVVKKEEKENEFRIADSVQTALYEGEGECDVEIVGKTRQRFSDKFQLDGITFDEPTVNFFSFNNPYGACQTCEGFGHVLGIDEDLVFPNKDLSVYDGAIAPWRSEKMQKWLAPLLKNGILFDFPIHRSIYDLDAQQMDLLWKGNEYFEGLNAFFKYLESKTHKIQYRVLLSRYRGRTACPDCKGTRLRKDAGYVKIAGKSIIDIVLKSISEASVFFQTIELDAYDKKISERILKEIINRLDYLDKVGLGYLTLNRLVGDLSGGEFQRIKLATSLGSALVGSMYILDEPSIGLHPRDTEKLIMVLKHLRDLGNTVIVVEHEEDIMRAADQLIDIGPGAGSLGGELIFQGKLDTINADTPSHTAAFLSGKETIPVPSERRKWKEFIEVKGVRENNLKKIDVKFPLHAMTMVTGVSGSGKSTLVKKIVYPALKKYLGGVAHATGKFENLEGNLNSIKQVEYVDQNPIGKSSRSNPVTYVKAYDFIRQLYADQALAKSRKYKPGHFSFNVDGGRCEICQGEGTVKIEMQFMADIYLKCEGCDGKRFKKEILDITYKDKNIADVLDMTIEESMSFFSEKTKIIDKLKPLNEVGLGYVRLGQSSNTLSGGEAQRVKLAAYLGGEHSENNLFIFDEPTTGLHFHDIKKLLYALNALVEQGNTVVVIEHNMDMIKNADWVIDLGPEGGANGGYLTFEGTPEELIKNEASFTAKFLKKKMP